MALMSDAIMGELLIPDDEVTDSWRDGLAEIARRTRAIFARHPWVASTNDEGAGAPAPNTLEHVEQSLAVAARTGLGVDEQFELIALVDDYVFGYVTRYREGLVPGEAEQRVEGSSTTSRRSSRRGEFPHLQALGGGAPTRARASRGSPGSPPTSSASSAGCRSCSTGSSSTSGAGSPPARSSAASRNGHRPRRGEPPRRGVRMDGRAGHAATRTARIAHLRQRGPAQAFHLPAFGHPYAQSAPRRAAAAASASSNSGTTGCTPSLGRTA